MAKQHDKQFKLDAIQYYEDHKDLGVRGCAENLGIGYSTLTKWLKDFRESGDILVRGSGNYASDEQKEIARLKRELRDAQDALDVLEKQSTFWENDGSHLSRSINTINKAKGRRIIGQPLIIHSDRGSQYVAKEYKKATENMRRSYSKKAFPWDNACIESFHSIIKREWLNRFKIRDYKQAYRLIFEYLEAFYNTKRIHSHCDYMSPDEFERVYKKSHTKAELLAG